MNKRPQTLDELIDRYYDNDVTKAFNDVRIWKAAQDKIAKVKKNDKADGGIDIGKLYSGGCTKDL